MTILARLVALAAALVLPLALVVVWADQFVTDTSGYVETVGPLAGDREVQEAAAARLAAAANGVVRDQAGPRAATATGAVTEDIALGVVGSEAFARVWRNANGVAHDQFEQVMTDDRNVPVLLDLSPVVDEVVTQVREDGVTLPEVDTSNALRVRLASSSTLDGVRTTYAAIDTFGVLVAVLWVLLVVGALALARDRRSLLAFAAAASVVTTALLYLGLRVGDEAAVSTVSATDRPLVRAVYDVLTVDLELWTLVALAAAVLVAVLNAVLPRAQRVAEEA